LRNFNYTKKISLISMYKYMYIYYVETRADNSGYTNHRVICFVVIGSSALLIVNKYSKFQMDTFDSVWEMDSDKKINRPRRWRWCWRRSDDNSSTFFLRKVELKTGIFIFSIYQGLSPFTQFRSDIISPLQKSRICIHL
jgi:hypothetical protein